MTALRQHGGARAIGSSPFSCEKVNAPKFRKSAENVTTLRSIRNDVVLREVDCVKYAARAFEAVTRLVNPFMSDHEKAQTIAYLTGIGDATVARIIGRDEDKPKSIKDEYLIKTVRLLRKNGIDPRSVEGGKLISDLFGGLEWVSAVPLSAASATTIPRRLRRFAHLFR